MRTACLALLVSFAVAGPAWADSLAVDFTTPNPGAGAGFNQTRGYEFSLSETRTVTGLAFFDWEANGIAESHAIGLWRVDQTLLATTTVTNASSTMASASASGQWLFENVTPFDLAPGSYVVGAYYGFAGDRFANPLSSNVPPGVIVTETGVTQVQGRLVSPSPGLGLAFPTRTFAFGFTLGNFGPGVLFADQAPPPPPPGAPEPGALLLLASGALVYFRRRK